MSRNALVEGVLSLGDWPNDLEVRSLFRVDFGSVAGVQVGSELVLPMEPRFASRALKLLLVKMSVGVVSHIACGCEPLVAVLATKGFLARVQLEVVLKTGLMAHDASAVSVGTLEANHVLRQLVIVFFILILKNMLVIFYFFHRSDPGLARGRWSKREDVGVGDNQQLARKLIEANGERRVVASVIVREQAVAVNVLDLEMEHELPMILCFVGAHAAHLWMRGRVTI